MNNDRHLDAIAVIAGRMLLAAGGFSNGYETRMDGEVIRRPNYHSNNVRIAVPNMGDLTVNAVRDMGRAIAEAVGAYMEEHKIESVVFTSKHDEHGCYVIHVNYVSEGVRVNLWRIEDVREANKA